MSVVLDDRADEQDRAAESTAAPDAAPPAPLALRVNFSWTFLGNVVYAACQWGMLAVLAKLGSTTVVGQFSLGLAVAAPVYMLTNLQLRSIQATDAKADYTFGNYLGLRLLMTAVGLLTVFSVSAYAGYPLETALVVALVGVAKGFESVSDVVYGRLQQQERMDRVAQSLLIKGPLSFVVLAVLMAVTGDVVWATAGLALCWALVLITFDLPSGRRFGGSLRPTWHGPTLGRLALLALPLGLVMMFISLNTNIPRYLVEHELGADALGIFAALSYIVVAGTTVVSALGQSAAPRLSKLYAANRYNAFKRLLIRLLGVGTLLGTAGVAVAALFGEPLLRLLYTSEYAAFDTLFVAVMGIAAGSYVLAFMGYAMTAARYFRVQLPIFAAAAASTLAVGWWLVPRFGLYGAVLALLASVVVRAIGASAVIAHILIRLKATSRNMVHVS